MAKKASKKVVTEKAVEKGTERSHDLPWNPTKVAIFKALKALKAIDAVSARSAKEVAAKAGVTAKQVRHYCYHAKAANLTGVVDGDGFAGYGFYLTKAGAAIKPDAELKAQEKAKADKPAAE